MSGNIKIIPPKENFLKVPKGAIFNDTIDTLTLGVYVKVLALGVKWTLNINGLSKSLSISVAKIRNALSVLEGAGYVRKYRVKGENGQFSGWDYEVYSEPITDISKNRRSENTDIGKNRPSENGDVYYKIDNENRDRKENIKKTIFRRPTIQEVSDYCKERNNGIDPQTFIDFYDSKGWKVGTTPMKDWKAAIRTWESKRRNESYSPRSATPPSPKERKPYTPKYNYHQQPEKENIVDYYRRVLGEINGTDNGATTDNPDEQ